MFAVTWGLSRATDLKPNQIAKVSRTSNLLVTCVDLNAGEGVKHTQKKNAWKGGRGMHTSVWVSICLWWVYQSSPIIYIQQFIPLHCDWEWVRLGSSAWGEVSVESCQSEQTIKLYWFILFLFGFSVRRSAWLWIRASCAAFLRVCKHNITTMLFMTTSAKKTCCIKQKQQQKWPHFQLFTVT